MKHLTKIFLFLLFVVNVHISFDHIINTSSFSHRDTIELLRTPNQYHEYNVTDFKQIEASFLSYLPKSSYKTLQKPNYQIYTQNVLYFLKFNSQKLISISLKTAVLQIVLNEISIQKSHCI